MNAKKTTEAPKSPILAAIEGGEELAKAEAAKAEAGAEKTNAEGAEGGAEPNPDAPTETTEAPEGVTEDTKSDQEEPKPAAWGGFKIEVGVTPPSRVGTGGTSKYDWAAFPAPSDPNDPKTWPSVFIPNVGAKTISKSIKGYRERLQKENPKAVVGEFSVSVIKDSAKKPTGVRVFRKS